MESRRICIYITYLFAKGVPEDRVRELLKNVELRVIPSANPSLQTLQRGEFTGWIRSDGCDCDTWIGQGEPDRNVNTTDQAVKRMKRKGWSDVKIERALSDMTPRYPCSKEEENTSLRRITKLFSEYHQIQGADVAGIFWHMYSGRIDEEKFDLTSNETVKISSESAEEILEQRLRNLPENQVLFVRLKSGR